MRVFVVYALTCASAMVSSGIGTVALVRSENAARILYTVEKGFILQSTGENFEKIRRQA